MKAGKKYILELTEEQYVEPKPGQPYMHRMRLLNINNKLKKLL